MLVPKQTTIDMANASIVFNTDFTVMGIYDSLNPNVIPDSERYDLILPPLAGTTDPIPQFILIKIEDNQLIVTDGQSKPHTAPKEYIKINDVWNTATEIIVGTGDLRPSLAFEIGKHPIDDKGIIISTPKNGKLHVYQL